MTRYRNLIDWQELDGTTVKIEVTKTRVFAYFKDGSFTIVAKVIQPRKPQSTLIPTWTPTDDLDGTHEPPF